MAEALAEAFVRIRPETSGFRSALSGQLRGELAGVDAAVSKSTSAQVQASARRRAALTQDTAAYRQMAAAAVKGAEEQSTATGMSVRAQAELSGAVRAATAEQVQESLRKRQALREEAVGYQAAAAAAVRGSQEQTAAAALAADAQRKLALAATGHIGPVAATSAAGVRADLAAVDHDVRLSAQTQAQASVVRRQALMEDVASYRAMAAAAVKGSAEQRAATELAAKAQRDVTAVDIEVFKRGSAAYRSFTQSVVSGAQEQTVAVEAAARAAREAAAVRPIAARAVTPGLAAANAEVRASGVAQVEASRVKREALAQDAAAYRATAAAARAGSAEQITASNLAAKAELELGLAAKETAAQQVAAAVATRAALAQDVVAYQNVAAAAVAGSQEQIAAIRLATAAERQLGIATLEASAASRHAGTGFRQTERELERFGRGGLVATGLMRGLGRAAAFASTAFIGGAGLVYAIRRSTEAAIGHQVIEGQLQAAIRANVTDYQQYTGAIERAITAQEHLGFSETDSVRAFTLAVRATKNVAAANNLAALAADVARGRNLGLVQATQLLVRVQAGQVGSLRRLGIQVAQGVTGTQALTIVQKQYADAAENYSRTAAGAQDRLNVAIHRTEVNIGTALLPTVARLSTHLADWLEKSKNQERIQRDVNEVVKDATGIVHGFERAAKLIAPPLKLAVDALGGIEHAVEVALVLGLAVKARKAALALETIIPASLRVRTAIVTDAAAEEAALAGLGAQATRTSGLLSRVGAYTGGTGALPTGFTGGRGGPAPVIGPGATIVGALAGSQPDQFPGLVIPTPRKDEVVLGAGAGSGKVGDLVFRNGRFYTVKDIVKGVRFGVLYSPPPGKGLVGTNVFGDRSLPPPVVRPESGTTVIGPSGPGASRAQRIQAALTAAQATTKSNADDLKALTDQHVFLQSRIAVEAKRLATATTQKQYDKYNANLQALAQQDASALGSIQAIEDQNAAEAQSRADKARAAAEKAKAAEERAARARERAYLDHVRVTETNLRSAQRAAQYSAAANGKLLAFYKTEEHDQRLSGVARADFRAKAVAERERERKQAQNDAAREQSDRAKAVALTEARLKNEQHASKFSAAANEKLLDFYKREEHDQTLSGRARLAFRAKAIAEAQREAKAVTAQRAALTKARAAALTVRETGLSIARQAADLAVARAGDNKTLLAKAESLQEKADRALISFYDKRAKAAKTVADRQEALQKKISAQIDLAGLKQSKATKKDSFTLSQLYQEAESEFKMYGSNYGGSSVPLSPQQERGTFSNIVLKSKGSVHVTQHFHAPTRPSQAMNDARAGARYLN